MDQSRFLKHFLPAERLLRGYLQAATRDVHETDDLLQQVSHVLWERFAEYDEARPFGAWAMGFARVQVLRWRQTKARGRKVLSGEALDQVAGAAEEFAAEPDARPALLAGCLQQLQARARNVMEMRYGQSLPIKQIAEKVGQQVGAVEMMLVRARRAVRECVERKMKPNRA